MVIQPSLVRRVLMTKGQEKLKGVHPLLIAVINEASKDIDFRITCGLRTVQEQRVLFSKGYSKTMKSKHLKQDDGYAHAFDFVPLPFTSWDDIRPFYKVADVLKRAAVKLGIQIEWGGDWVSFKDFPHIQLKR